MDETTWRILERNFGVPDSSALRSQWGRKHAKCPPMFLHDLFVRIANISKQNLIAGDGAHLHVLQHSNVRSLELDTQQEKLTLRSQGRCFLPNVRKRQKVTGWRWLARRRFRRSLCRASPVGGRNAEESAPKGLDSTRRRLFDIHVGSIATALPQGSGSVARAARGTSKINMRRYKTNGCSLVREVIVRLSPVTTTLWVSVLPHRPWLRL